MKITIDKKELQDALKVLSGIISTSWNGTILCNILLIADNDEVKIIGSNGDISLSVKLIADIDVGGSIGIPFASFSKLISTLKSGNIEIDIEDVKITVAQDEGKYEITGLRASEFPSFEIAENVYSSIEIDKHMLSKAINCTEFAITKDVVRVNFSGIFLKLADNLITTVGTNGQALSKFTAICENSTNDEMIIPKPTIEQIKKILMSIIETNILIEYSQSALIVNAGQYVLQSKLIGERFPDYEQVIPRDNDKTAIVDRELLISALTRVSTLVDKNSSLVKLSFSEHKLQISGHDYQNATEANDNLGIYYGGDSLEIGFSAKDLLNILNHIDSDDVEISMKTVHSATLITPTPQIENETHKVIQMPLRLQGEE